MSLKKIKQYLKSTDKMRILLVRIGLKNIKLEQNGTLVTCGLPNSSNHRGVQVKLNGHLSMAIRNKSVKGDIIDLISYMTYEGFGKFDETVKEFMRNDTIRWLTSNLDGDFEDFDFDDTIEYDFDEYKKEAVLENEVYTDIILNEFIPRPHIIWLLEGINTKTHNEFDIRYNSHEDQIVIPCRNIKGEIVSLKVRNLTHDSSGGGYIPKYLSLLKPSRGVDLYGLWKTLDYIIDKKEIILFESEKSVIKAWQYGYKNTAALATSSISYRQREELLRVLPDGSEIIIALDNDMVMHDIKRIANSFRKHNFKITYIKENSDDAYLGEKDSPIDKGKEVFDNLYANRSSLI